MKLVEAYRKQYGFNGISLMPTNLYGPGDNFDLQNSHVLPALIRKLDDAQREGRKEVQVWGTGTPRREFLHVDDLADACLFAMRNYEGEQFLNTGTGEDVTIRELAELIAKVVGFEGNLVFDTTKPDGTPRKLLDVSRFHALGWKARIPLEQGIRETYKWYVDQVRAGAELRGAHALSH
jgi:GDP-L-fucose synthase